MPNPLEALRKASTIGAGPNEQARAQINDTPVTQSVMPMLPEGALGGLLGWAKGFLPGASKVASTGILGPAEAQAASTAARDILNPATGQKIQQMYSQARPAVEALERAGTFAGDRTVGGLHRLPVQATETLGEANPEYTPVGGEGIYNTGVSVLKKLADPIESVYHRMLLSGGR